MNRKTLYLNVLAAALLLGAGTGQASAHTLEEAIRLQARDASAAITAQTRANLRVQPLVLDVPGVEVGRIKLVQSGPERNLQDSRRLMETSSIDLREVLDDLLADAFEASAVTVAITVAD